MTKEEILAKIKNFRGANREFSQELPKILEAMLGLTEPVAASDVTDLTDDELDALEVGDKVAKQTGTAEHLYVVSYKDAENGGLCLTYTDASVVETVSYDHTESGWAYNSTDVTPIPGGGGGVTALIVEGTIADDEFAPNEGEATFDEAKAAFLAGSPVLLKASGVLILVDIFTEASGAYPDSLATADGTTWSAPGDEPAVA
jgi:hypothetical protein